MSGPSTTRSRSPFRSASRLAGFALATAQSTLIRATAAVAVVATALMLLVDPALAADDLVIEKLVNGDQADSAPGPVVRPGATVTLTYRVTVNNPDGLYDIQVLDTSGVVPNCDTNGDGRPDGSNVHQGPVGGGESFTCTATQAAGTNAGTLRSSGVAKGSDFFASANFESRDAGHFTVQAATTVTASPTTRATTSTRRPTTSPPATTRAAATQPATQPATTGPATTAAAAPTSATTATSVGSPTPAFTNETGSESPGVAGARERSGGADNQRPSNVTAPQLVVESMVNGLDADEAPGPAFESDEEVRWTHLIVNAGSSRLVDVTVTDSFESTILCRPGTPSATASRDSQISVPFDLRPGQSVVCESERLDSRLAETSALAALVTVEAFGPTTGTQAASITVADPIHLQALRSDDANTDEAPGRLAFSDDEVGQGGSGLTIPWTLLPGLVALVAGASFLLGLVRRLDS